VRKKGGVSFDKSFSETWSAFASYTLERREGTRPFGGGFFFNFAPTPPSVGASMETIEPIDYSTHNVIVGLKYAEGARQFNLTGNASIFRNNIDTLTWENPFNINPGQANATNIQRGRYALYPDNEAYNVKAEYTQSWSSFYNSRFTVTGALGRMHQNDALIPLTVNTGTAGLGLNQFNLANWNTTVALSQQNANAAIDTALLDLGYHAVPISKLSLHAKARFYETRNHTDYTAFNPSTGQYGYPALDGAKGTVLPGENGFYTPGQVGPNNWQYRNIPFAYKQSNYSLNADYQLTTKTQLSGGYEREEFHRDFRERDRTWEDHFRIAFNSRGFEMATVRLSYEYGDRRGSAYNYNPYEQFFTSSLPGYNNPDGAFPFTLADLRKYDVADRKQQVINGRINMTFRDDLDGFSSLQYKSNTYPASYGRTGHQDQVSVNFELNYQPTPLVNAYAFYFYQYSRLEQGNINDLMIPGGSPNAGGDNYPIANAWSLQSKDSNDVLGLGVQYDFTKFRIGVKYTFANARSPISYQANSTGATTIPLTAEQIGNGYPDLTYRQHLAEANAVFPLQAKLAVRLFYRYENTRVFDWHYDGLSNNLLQQQRLYLDPGPQNYHANVFGVFIQCQL
jgi:MtrB/PioB family decaheme-associated outer membrane protein